MVARSVEATTLKECFEFTHYLGDARDLLGGDRFENGGQIGEVFSVADDDGEVSASEGSVLLVGSVSGACARRRS